MTMHTYHMHAPRNVLRSSEGQWMCFGRFCGLSSECVRALYRLQEQELWCLFLKPFVLLTTRVSNTEIWLLRACVGTKNLMGKMISFFCSSVYMIFSKVVKLLLMLSVALSKHSTTREYSTCEKHTCPAFAQRNLHQELFQKNAVQMSMAILLAQMNAMDSQLILQSSLPSAMEYHKCTSRYTSRSMQHYAILPVLLQVWLPCKHFRCVCEVPVMMMNTKPKNPSGMKSVVPRGKDSSERRAST